MKLSIVLTTYNHEKYIRQCLDSILDQQYDFDWELIIGHDHSDDNTLMVVESYRSKFKHFTICNHEKNVGIAVNFTSALSLAKGNLLAFIDGDDYNISRERFKKQVEVFEKYPDVAVCFTNGYKYIESADQMVNFYENDPKIPQKFNLEHFFRSNPKVHPATLMCRKSSFPHPLPKLFYEYVQADWILIALCAQNGNIYFLDEYLACYRVHQKSLLRTAKRLPSLISAKKLNEDMNRYLNYKYAAILGNNNWYDEQLAYEYVREKLYRKSFYSGMRYLFSKKDIKLYDIKYFLATIGNILFHRENLGKKS